MSKRDDLFQRFGPRLLEAFMFLIKNDNNQLRELHGLPPRTDEQIYDQIINHLSTRPPFSFETEGP